MVNAPGGIWYSPSSNRQHADSRALRVHHDESTRGQFRRVLLDSCENLVSYRRGAGVVGANGHDAWTRGAAVCEECAEVEVVGQDEVVVGSRPVHQFGVERVNVPTVDQ